jgi:hypothetical protein
MVKLLAFFSPWMKYIWVVLLVASFGGGVWITQNHYQAKIQTMKTENDKAFLAYQNRIIEKDYEYRVALAGVQNQLKVVQGKLKNEVSKPEYSCPVPDDGIRLLNDAIRAQPGTKSSQ